MSLFSRMVFTIVFLFRQDLYSVPRTILPHGASFHGHILTLNVTYESTKDTFSIEVCVYRLCVSCHVDLVATWFSLILGLRGSCF